ncbi:MAG: trigger factor [Eubacteriales bacterium]|nr:trigger factor [Eubacteriales bacterium]
MKKKILISTLLLASSLTMTGWTGFESADSYGEYLTLGEYTGRKVERNITTITDDDIQAEIQNELYYSAEIKELDRAAQSGDIVNIDFDGTLNGEALEDGSASDYEYALDTGSMIDGFDENLIGLKAGETTEFDVTFPDDYNGVLDGQTAHFTVTMNSVSEQILPEYNDAYVKEAHGYNTTSEYEAALKTDLQAMYDEEASSAAVSDLLSEIIEDTTFDNYPEDLVQEMAASIESDNASFAEQLGLDLSDLLGEDYDVEEDAKSQAEERMVVSAIAAKENLTVSDEELKSYAEDNYADYELESADDFIEYYGEESLKYELLYSKVAEFLIANTEFEDVFYDSDLELSDALSEEDLENFEGDENEELEIFDDLDEEDDAEESAEED